MTSYSFSSLIIVGSSASSLYWPLNFGSTYHVRGSSLNMLWITYPSRSSSWNTPEPISFKILKGLYLLSFNFFESRFDWIFLFSSHMLSLTFSPWGFHLFLLNCLFMFFCAFSIAFVVCSQLFCSPARNSSTLRISDCTTRLPFHRCLSKFNLNGVLSVVVCFLSLYWNSAAANYSIQLFCW